MSLINLEELISKKPYLKLYFQGLKEGSDSFTLNQVKQKEEYYVSHNGKNLTSSIAPLTASLRMVGETKIRNTDLVIVLGLGNPHLIQTLNEKILPNQTLIL